VLDQHAGCCTEQPAQHPHTQLLGAFTHVVKTLLQCKDRKMPFKAATFQCCMEVLVWWVCREGIGLWAVRGMTCKQG